MNKISREARGRQFIFRAIGYTFLLSSMLLLVYWTGFFDSGPSDNEVGRQIPHENYLLQSPWRISPYNILLVFFCLALSLTFASKLLSICFLNLYLLEEYPREILSGIRDKYKIALDDLSTVIHSLEYHFSTYIVKFSEISTNTVGKFDIPSLFGRRNSFLSLAGMSYTYLQKTVGDLRLNKDSSLYWLTCLFLAAHEVLTSPLSIILDFLISKNRVLTLGRFHSYRSFFLLLCFVSNPRKIIHWESTSRRLQL